MSDPRIRKIFGPTILLGSGTYFDFEAPETTPPTIEDIAYGLAHTARFSGQCVSSKTGKRVFYSVAEHCVRMSWVVAPEHALAALMHDAHEAVCGDMTRPLKSICPDYKSVEKRCEAAILAHFGISLPMPDAVNEADLRMLLTEQRQLMRRGANDDWPVLRRLEPYPFEIVPYASDDAAESFLRRWRQLSP